MRVNSHLVHKLHQEYIPCLFEDVPLVEFMYLAFERIPGESYRRRLRSLLLYLCDVFRALINSPVSWFCTSAVGLVLFQMCASIVRREVGFFVLLLLTSQETTTGRSCCSYSYSLVIIWHWYLPLCIIILYNCFNCSSYLCPLHHIYILHFLQSRIVKSDGMGDDTCVS